MSDKGSRQLVDQEEIVTVGKVAKVKKEKVKGKKKGKAVYIVIFVLLIAMTAIGVFAYKAQEKEDKKTPITIDYTQTGRFAYDTYLQGLAEYNIETLGVSKASYVADEARYTNENEVRLDWIKFVTSQVSFSYPSVDQVNVYNEVMLDEAGLPIKILSSMISNEQVTMTSLDYSKIADLITADKEAILQLVQDKGYSSADYTYNDEMTNLMLEYLMTKKELPTISQQISLPLNFEIVLNTETNKQASKYYIVSDEVVDNILFASDAFHSMTDIFVKAATGWTGEKIEQYSEMEEMDNAEYLMWKTQLDTLMAEDNGKWKWNSEWDFVYKRDEDGSYIYEDGERVIDYYVLLDEEGESILAPEMKVMVEVQKERTVEDIYVPESIIPYTFLGSYYCQFVYEGESSTVVEVGDGSFEKPAGIGTPMITKALCSDGLYHDVSVTLINYYVNQDAIDYAVSLSEKNRGLDNASAIRYIMLEVSIKNLESAPITLVSDIYLADSSENSSAKTGTIAGVSESQTINSQETVVFSDWVSSSTIDKRYICWGKTFARVYPVVWFNVPTTATSPEVEVMPTPAE